MNSRLALLVILLVVPLVIEVIPNVLVRYTSNFFGNFSSSISGFFLVNSTNASIPIEPPKSNNISSDYARNAAAVRLASNAPSINFFAVVINNNPDALKLIFSIIVSLIIIVVFQIKFKIFNKPPKE